MKNPLDDLFGKYLRGKISPEELRMLRSMIAEMDDHELDRFLSLQWEEYHQLTHRNRVSFETLCGQLGLRPSVAIVSQWRRIVAIAAAVMVPILIGVSLFFYQQNQRLEKFLDEETLIVVGGGDRSEVTLPDGSRIYLNARSTLSYPSQFGYGKRCVALSGEAYMEIAKDPQRPFKVQTSEMEIEVLGTTFNVSAYEDESYLETTLIEGSVAISSRMDPNRRIMLKPNQKAILDKQSGNFKVEETDLRYETAWRRNELVFRSAELSDIFERIERYYGVEITVNTPYIPTEHFTGAFKEDSPLAVLKILQLHYPFTFTFRDNQATITFSTPPQSSKNSR